MNMIANPTNYIPSGAAVTDPAMNMRSPLDTLVRKTSGKKLKKQRQGDYPQQDADRYAGQGQASGSGDRTYAPTSGQRNNYQWQVEDYDHPSRQSEEDYQDGAYADSAGTYTDNYVPTHPYATATASSVYNDDDTHTSRNTPTSNYNSQDRYQQDLQSRNHLNLSLQPHDHSRSNSSNFLSLNSPLLHNGFARDSVGTASFSDNSYCVDQDTRTSRSLSQDFRDDNSRGQGHYAPSNNKAYAQQTPKPQTNDSRQHQQSQYLDRNLSVTSSLGPRSKSADARRSGRSSRRQDFGFDDDGGSEYRQQYFTDDTSSVYSTSTILGGPALRDSWRSTDTQMQMKRPDVHYGSDTPPHPDSPGLPSVVVSSPDAAARDGPKSGRAPIVKPMMANFSRPVRESGYGSVVGEGQSVTPQLPPDMREQKKAVLERNASRNNVSGPTPSAYTPSPLSKPSTTTNDYFGKGDGQVEVQLTRPSVDSANGPGSSASSSNPNYPKLQPSHIRDMQERSNEPVSLYSTYSYYQYDGRIPSPSSTGNSPNTPTNFSQKQEEAIKRVESRASRASRPGSETGLQTPEDYLQLGIKHHEANRLQESVRCFERSAKEGGGCGVGMLMYGLSLRHGWGCAKNEQLGFKWVQKAAECAVGDLEKVRTGQANVDLGAVESELVLAIYEVGQCFFHGWGVAKDQKMGVSYYMVAARLGDSDAQGDLGFCLANGKGCKKDKKEAAKWYRAAVKQGMSEVGLGWIYKEKYQ